MKKILILGRLPKDTETMSLYNNIASICKKFTPDILSPLDTIEFKGGDRERYTRAFAMVREADLIIGELSQPSTGQGMELREAAMLAKPIVILAKAKTQISGMVTGCPSVKETVFYRSPDDLKEKLSNSLQKRM